MFRRKMKEAPQLRLRMTVVQERVVPTLHAQAIWRSSEQGRQQTDRLWSNLSLRRLRLRGHPSHRKCQQ